MGKVRGDQIECAYHGWQFNCEGRCTAIPCHGPAERTGKLRFRIPTYRVIEQDGWVWIKDISGNPLEEKLPRSLPRDKNHRWFDIKYQTIASPDLILENGMDSAHTCFVHRGLFRSNPAQFINVVIRGTNDRVVAETKGENQKKSGEKDLRVLTNKKEIRHVDEYHYPGSLQIDYWFGKSHLVTHLHVTPNDTGKTSVYIRMGLQFGFFTRAIYPVIWLITRKVVKQDRAILENQQRMISRMGKRSFHHSLADMSAVMLSDLYKSGPRANKPEWEQEENVSFKL
nr:Rieske 2Fe-2S domain-containing protein [Robiginitalea sp. SC105]